MKKIFLLLTFILLSIAGFSQGFKTGGIFLRVTDSATYVNSAYVTAAHADNYAEIFYSVSSGLFWKWNGSAYETLSSGGGGAFWSLTGTSTLTGNTTIDGDGNDLTITNFGNGTIASNGDLELGATTDLQAAANGGMNFTATNNVDFFTQSDSLVFRTGAGRQLVIDPDGAWKIDNVAGSAGQVPTSQGPGLPMEWTTPSGSGGSLNTLAPNIQTGATYTVAATDTAKVIYMRHASTPQTATIPSGLKVGSTFTIVQDTTATTTIACTGCDLIGTATLTAKEVSVWHHRETGKYVRLGSSGGGSGTPGGADTQVQYNNAGAFGGEADMTYNATTNTFTVDNAAVDTEAYDATGWDGDLTVPTKDALRDKIQTIVATDYSRAAVAVSAGTLTMDINSLSLKNFDLTATQSGAFTIAFSNATNLVEAKLTCRLTGSIAITMPSAVMMQNYETINGRWNTSTNVLTLVGTTATPFLLTFYSDGTNIICQASDSIE